MGKAGRAILAVWVLIVIAVVFAPGKLFAQRGSSLDIEAELSRPGVKLVVVEFFATWCEPCMAAVPQLESQA
jgi:thiol-disulfide isomerase/thioredoxin